MPASKKLIATPLELQWPYKRHYEIFKGIQDYAKNHTDWHFDTGNSPELAIRRGRRYDGIVGRITPECMRAARRASIPMVNVWVSSPVCSKLPGVQIDYYEAARMAAEHLITRGFKRLAYFGFENAQGSEIHYRGVKEMAEKHGCSCSRHDLNTLWDFDNKHWLRFEKSVLQAQAGWQGPVGAVCIADEVARAVATICLRCDWAIPDELAVIGCSDDSLICTSAEPYLSSVDVNYEKCGYEAARMLDSFMRGAKRKLVIVYVPPNEIVVRQSSDAFAVSDPKVAQALRHMADHGSSPLSVPEIARAVGVGRKMLERRFRRHLGRTINDELIRLRVAKLKRLLIESNANIAELGEKAGFGNSVSMQKMFKRITGMTPRDYRERHGPRPVKPDR